MRSRRCFLRVGRVYFDLLTACILVESLKYLTIPKIFYGLIHSWEWIVIAYCDGVEFPVIDVESQIFVLFGPNFTSEPHSVWSASMAFIANMLSVSICSISRAFGPGRYDTKYIRRIYDGSKPTCVLRWIYELNFYLTCLEMVQTWLDIRQDHSRIKWKWI